MSLIDLRNYLRNIKVGNLFQLAAYFNAEPQAVRIMLSHWERKGCVRKCTKTPNCGSKCFKCNPLLTEIYEWVE